MVRATFRSWLQELRIQAVRNRLREVSCDTDSVTNRAVTVAPGS
jgi:hypothetical protein